MRLNKYLEFVQNDFEPIKSFYLKDELSPKVWDGDKIKQDIRDQLLTIAQDFYNTTDLSAEIKDIILTGSLANYNWSNRYSDYDLHIVIDYKEVNDDYDLVEKLTDYAKKIWNQQHEILIKGYEAEVFIQDNNTKLVSSGVYSLLNDKWNIEPIKKEFEPDESLIREKGESVMSLIDDIEAGYDSYEYDKLMEEIKKVWSKIKRYRKSGLDSESGELSVGNLAFKLLRRNGYIQKIMDLKGKAYDGQFK